MLVSTPWVAAGKRAGRGVPRRLPAGMPLDPGPAPRQPLRLGGTSGSAACPEGAGRGEALEGTGPTAHVAEVSSSRCKWKAAPDWSV
eukprot:8685426-Alexandrium_andersonii.AAC.1